MVGEESCVNSAMQGIHCFRASKCMVILAMTVPLISITSGACARAQQEHCSRFACGYTKELNDHNQQQAWPKCTSPCCKGHTPVHHPYPHCQWPSCTTPVPAETCRGFRQAKIAYKHLEKAKAIIPDLPYIIFHILAWHIHGPCMQEEDGHREELVP